MSRTLPLLVVLGTLTGPARLAAADPPAAALQDQMRKLIDAAEPSVVSLVVSHDPKYPLRHGEDRARGILGGYTPAPVFNGRFGPRGERDRLDLSDAKNIPDHGYGTGLVIDPSGLILTNYHLVEGATKIYVRPPGQEGSYANVHAADGRSDLAVLKLISTPRLPAAKLADVRLHDGPDGKKASVFRGMWVVSMAHPFAAGFADGTPSASWGILANVRRRAPGFGGEDQRTGHLYQYGSLLQTDARLNLGCSGGALLNLDGEVIGLTTSTAAVAGSETAGGFAVPMTANTKRIIGTLRDGREVEYGFLGVTPGDVSTNPPGLYIQQVSPFTPAYSGGLVNGEVIQAIDGVPVRNADDLFLNVGAALAGTRVKLTIARDNGPVREVPVTLAKFVHSHPTLASVRPEAVYGLRVEYSSVIAQQVAFGRATGLSHRGVLVKELEPNSRAEAAFKALGGNDPTRWLIKAVNGTAVESPAEFRRAVAAVKGVLRMTVVNPTDPNDAGRAVILP